MSHWPRGDSKSRPLCQFILEIVFSSGKGRGEGSLKENIQPHACEISAQNQSSFLIMRAVRTRALVQSEMMACVNIWSVTDLWVGEQKNKISR